jgi:hypothetical protein
MLKILLHKSGFSVILTSIFILGTLISTAGIVQNRSSNPIQLFQSTGKAIPDKQVKNNLELILNQSALESILNSKPEILNITIPSLTGNQNWTIELTRHEIVTSDFRVRTSDGKTYSSNQLSNRALYYNGRITGDSSSLVAFSFFDHEVMGTISNGVQIFDLGIYGEPLLQRYVLVDAGELSKLLPFECESDAVSPQSLITAGSPPAWNCTRVFKVYFECDYNLYTSRQSSVTNAVNFVTGLYNVVNTLFSNESLVSQVSEIFVWTSADPFTTNTSSSAYLYAFRNYRTTFNGDFAHFLSTRGTNYGGVAFLNGLCNSSSYAYSNISNSYSNFPSYSWSVNVVTHELGHNLGSPHTHSCSWPGGAIDNCYTTEGGCPVGPAPVNGGTIMSYCHLTSNGINFNNGFGPLPGNLIRSSVSNASCLPVSPNSSSIPVSCFPTTSNLNNTSYVGPSRVALNTINNYSSTSVAGHFEDFTCAQTTDLAIGNTYSIWVTTFGKIQNARAFIDYNNDGIFETSERILFSNGTSSNQIHTSSFIVPSSALINTWLRMRVLSDSSTNTDPQPCGILQFGQAEDYRIQILTNGFYPGEIASADETLCSPADPANIIFSVNPGGAASYGYQWYTASGNPTPPVIGNSTTGWTIITGANSPSYNPPAGLTQYASYACIVTPNNGASRWALGARKIAVNTVTFVGYLIPNNQTFSVSGDPSPINLGGGVTGGEQGGTVGNIQWYSAPGIQQAPTGTVIPTNWTAIPNANGPTYDPPVQFASISYAVMIDPTRLPDCTGFTWANGVSQVTIQPLVFPGNLTVANQTFCAGGGDPLIINFVDLPSGAASFSYQWYYQNGIVNAPTAELPATWNFITGATSPSYDPPAGLTQSRTYACFVTPNTGSGSWANGARQITLLPPFNPGTVTSSDQTLCSPADPALINLSVAPSGSGEFTYQWYYQNQTVNCPIGNSTTGWTIISTGITNSFDPAAGATTTNRTFAVLVTPIAKGSVPACGISQWANNCRKIFVPPTLNRGTLASGNQTLSSGGDPNPISFSTQPVGSGSFNFQWYFQNSIVSAPSGSSLSGWTVISTASSNSYDPPSGLTQSRTFACYVTPTGTPTCGTAGWAAGARQVTVSTSGIVDFGTIAQANQTFCSTGGDPSNILFSISPSGAINFSFQWYFQNGTVAAPTGTSLQGWTPIQLATGPSYDPPAGLSQARSFACFVTPSGASGQWASGVRVINVLPPFSPGTISSGDQTFCNSGNPANITLSSNPVGSGAFQWRWYFRETSVGNCPTGSTVPVGWNTNQSSPNITGTTTTGNGISFDPISAGSINNGRTFAVLITPVSNGTVPACGTPQWASNCRKTTVVPCRLEEQTELPLTEQETEQTKLLQNQPNPFNDYTTIELELSGKSDLGILSIQSAEGILIRQFTLNGKGKHSIWLEKGTLASGIYFYSLTTPEGYRVTKRMVLVN